MNLQTYQWIFLIAALFLANLPWLSQRCFLIFECPEKSAWIRLFEWGVLLVITGVIGYLLEQRIMGTNHPQDWEFYAVAVSLFMVFAFPGFVYRYVR